METLTEFHAWTADLSGGMLLQLHYEEATQDAVFPVCLKASLRGGSQVIECARPARDGHRYGYGEFMNWWSVSGGGSEEQAAKESGHHGLLDSGESDAEGEVSAVITIKYTFIELQVPQVRPRRSRSQ